ncbi:MAG: TorF family putative porin [Thermoanaerobaculia bacterium]|nr:TorF family putative porin [Thermoanaerobaculia bacterium]
MRSVLPLLAVVVLAAPGAGHASGLSAEVTAASDFVFRGFSHSDTEPVVQAGVRYRHRSGLFGGLWASTVEFPPEAGRGDGPDAEVHAFAGYAGAWGEEWSWSGTAIRYEYTGADPALDLSYSEAQVALEWRQLVQLTAAWTPGFLGSDRSALFVEMSGRYPLPRRLELNAGAGIAELDNRFEPRYLYGHAGAAWSTRRLELAVGFYVSDSRAVPRWGEVIDGRWVASLSARLP